VGVVTSLVPGAAAPPAAPDGDVVDGDVPRFVLGVAAVPAAPDGDGDVLPNFVLGVTPPGPVVVVPDAPPLFAPVPFPVGGRFVGRA
jgi:hypothetical protein